MIILHISVLLLYGITTADCVVLGQGNKSYKTYTSPSGQEVSCLTRTPEDACPPDHEITECLKNGEKVRCSPCNVTAGYRTCVRVHSGIDYVKCYRPSIYCESGEFSLLHTYPNGGCYNFTCVKTCNTSGGYELKGSECVLRKCGINSTLIDGKCRPCPTGTHKLTVGFENCSIIPESESQKPSSTERIVNATEAEDKTGETTSESSSDKGEKKESDEPSALLSVNNGVIVILATVIPVTGIIIIVTTVYCCLCRQKDRGASFHCLSCNNCCCVMVTETPAVNGTAVRLPAGPEGDVEHDGINCGEINQSEITDRSDHSFPPTYRTEDAPHVVPRNEPSANGDLSHQWQPETAAKNIPPTPSTRLDETVQDPTIEETTPLINSSLFPTLATKDGSSLVNPNQQDQNPPSAMEENIALRELSDSAASAGSLANFTFGSPLKVSSFSDVTSSELQ